MTNFDYLVSLAALFAWREEYHANGVNGALAMMFVLRNREKSGQGDMAAVIETALSTQAQNRPSSNSVFPDVRDPEFKKILDLCEQVFKDEIVDNLTGGALRTFPYGERVAKVGTTEYYK